MGYWNVNKVSLETLIETGVSSVTGYEPWSLMSARLSCKPLADSAGIHSRV